MSRGATGRRLRAVLALAALLGAAGCSLLDPYNLVARHLRELPPAATEFVASPAPATLDRARRERAFDFVWNTIHDRYHDPHFNGVDWAAVGRRYRPLAMAAPDDAAFWDVLDRMTGELRDSHTRVESPRRVEQRERGEVVTLGFSFLPLAGRIAVLGVHPQSDAWWAGVRPGMFMVSIDGEPAADVYARLYARSRIDSTPRSRQMQAVRRLATGPEGSKTAFTFERADGSRFRAVLARRTIEVPKREMHRVLPSGFGYVRFSQWTIGLTLRALAALDALHDTPGLIVDLRGNPGGSVHAVNLLLDRFFARRTALGHTTTRDGRPVTLLFGAVQVIRLAREVGGREDAYRGPVAILVDGRSASGSELFAGTMQAAGRARIVGRTSCGCMLGFLGYAEVPGGAELAYSEVGFVLSNGRRIEGEGVVPDVEVPIRLADLRRSRDRPLEEAQALLARMARSGGGARPGAPG